MTQDPTSEPARPAAAVPSTGFSCQLFRAAEFQATSGANFGDPVADADVLCAGDVYQLIRDAQPLSLRLVQPQGTARHRVGAQTVADGSEVGQPGDQVTISSRLTLMAPDGDKVDMLILRHHGPGGPVALYAMPLAPMSARTDYTLLRCEADPDNVRLSDIACVSFGRGTMITLADGRQTAIEALVPGDRILTRDHGPQPLRWIGRATLRALGSFAPVVITRGTLGNEADLIVSQQHRVFLYHRKRPAGLRTAELLVQSKHLVDNSSVFLREGGFVDYFSLVFDSHEIIYAEGIPAESLMVNPATVARLPEGLAEEVQAQFPDLSQRQHFGTELDGAGLSQLGPKGLFKKGLPG